MDRRAKKESKQVLASLMIDCCDRMSGMFGAVKKKRALANATGIGKIAASLALPAISNKTKGRNYKPR